MPVVFGRTATDKEGDREIGAKTATAIPEDGRLSTHYPNISACRGAGGLPARPARLTPWFTRLRFVDRERTAIEFFPIEPLDGSFGRRAVRHLDKPKAFGAAGITIGNHIDLVHITIRLEELAKVMISRAEGKIAYKNIHARILW